MTAVEILAGEVVTGRRLTTLPVTSASFTSTLGAAGDISAVLPLKDPEVAARSSEFFGQLEPWRSFLAVQVSEQIVEAGPITAHEYDDTTGHLTVKAQGLRALMARREAVDETIPTADQVTSVLAYSGLSLGTIGRRLVEQTLDNPGGSLPIVLPPNESGNHERTYPGYERSKVGDLLDDLSGVQGGPEFAFQPRLTADGNGVEWVMRAGTNAEPLLSQTGSDWIFDTTTQGAVAGLSVSSDAGNRINAVTVTGAGMDTATLTSRQVQSGEWDRGYPLLEDTYSHSTVSRQRTLDAWTPAYMTQGSRPWTTWKLRVRRDGPPALGQYRPGDWVMVHVRADHPYLRGGAYRARISRISGSIADQNVSIDLMPTLERR